MKYMVLTLFLLKMQRFSLKICMSMQLAAKKAELGRELTNMEND